jgi:hypothetical protein
MVGNSFTNACKDWNEGMYDSFEQWAVRQFGHKDLETDDEVDLPVHMRKAKTITFKINKRGGFVLPPIVDYNTIRQRQRVVRGTLGRYIVS